MAQEMGQVRRVGWLDVGWKPYASTEFATPGLFPEPTPPLNQGV